MCGTVQEDLGNKIQPIGYCFEQIKKIIEADLVQVIKACLEHLLKLLIKIKT